MIDIYMTGARFHVDEPKAEMDAALLLDSIRIPGEPPRWRTGASGRVCGNPHSAKD